MSQLNQVFRLTLKFKNCDIQKANPTFYRSMLKKIAVIDSKATRGFGFDGKSQLINIEVSSTKQLSRAVAQVTDLLKRKNWFYEVKRRKPVLTSSAVNGRFLYISIDPLRKFESAVKPKTSMLEPLGRLSLLRWLATRIGLTRSP